MIRTISFTFAFFFPLLALMAFPVLSAAEGETERRCVTYTQNGAPVELCFDAPLPSEGAGDTGFNRQGVFGCNVTGSYAMSVGSLAAIGGSYVPVNDAAVTLNTGYLVYKECVLKGITNRMREDAIARLVNQSANQFVTGRNGGPMYPEILTRDILERSDAILDAALAGPRLSALNPAFSEEVRRAIARSYAAETRNSGSAVSCSYRGTPEELAEVIRGERFTGYGDLLALSDPNCIPLYAYYRAQDLVRSDIAADYNEMIMRLSWSGGVYDVDVVLPDGTRRVITPGFLVAGTIQQHLGAGFDQQKNADDIDEMVGTLFAGIGNAILNEVGGLQGLVQRIAGRPSYLDQIVEESSAGVRDSALNAAIQILSSARKIEQGFLDAERATAGALASAVSELRGAENQCWNVIIPKAREYAAKGECQKDASGTETCSSPFTLQIATSTDASQRVIDSFITPIASTTANRIVTTSRTVDAIDALIARVLDSNTPEVQQQALKELDALVTAKALHDQYDLKQAQDRAENTRTSIGNLVTDTIKTWGDDPDKVKGWCNVNNPDVVKMWAQKWKK